MITFPSEFVATKFPGYFWNTVDERLYSIKVTGVLRPLKRSKPSWHNYHFDGYRVSVGGRPRNLSMKYLNSLQPANSIIPVRT